MLAAMPVVCNASGNIVPLLFNISLIPGDDNGNNGNLGHPKNPIDYPSVAIEGHTLYLYDGCDETTLRLVSSDEIIVFNTVVEEGTSIVNLPATLTGEYRLEIVDGDIIFYCYIEL